MSKITNNRVELNQEERLKIARVLYDFKDEGLQGFNRGDEFYTRSGDTFIEVMARLSSYAETFPKEELNKLVNGSKIDPYNSFAYDPEVRKNFLLWFEKTYLNQKTTRK